MAQPDQLDHRIPDASPGPPGPAITAATLRDLLTTENPRRPQLLRHEELLLVTVGHGSHDIDFVTYPCRPGTLLRAGVGQVVRPGAQPGLDAIVVRWRADHDLPAAGWDTRHRDAGGDHVAPHGQACWQLAGETEDAIITEVSQLVVDSRRPHRSRLVDELLRHQLRVLLLRIALLPEETAAGVDRGVPGAGRDMAGELANGSSRRDTFRQFRAEVERDFARTRRVEEYAERLQCAVRTLTRASLDVTGRTAKQVIDDRVALQAKRLLAATSLPVAEIGQRLGFAEPTNFGRFFQREVGCSPGTFRAGITDRPPVTGPVAATGMIGTCRSPRAATMRYEQH
ncbi:helix-turn-helix domain-containing protein [Micromonospora sp. NBC_01813]|uniref:helix-turn-helix domain-containing protein n=1 Tax=Micromonospora sp. NBC_01813 TaxID=2975988 RepID=UPI002DDBCFE7|nr:AraC family transcriptional regulator [Micromonospora sp. NBC_01813]WSA11319.1 AraC family transcriptional regulator [Micromonospora sp. NBC_01813]